MKVKILVWIDGNFYNFFLSKYIKNNHDCDIYGIFDVTNNPKKYFETQNNVNFSKVWFFHEYIKKPFNTPDIDYIKNFEKKYDINLMLESINERSFNKFNKFYEFQQNEILSILEQECKLFENILDEIKPNFLIMHLPFFQHDNILYKLCKKRGINCLILRTSRINPLKCLIHEDDENEELKFPISNEKNSISLEFIQQKLKNSKKYNVVKKSSDFKTQKTTKTISALSNYLISNNENIKTHYTYFGRQKLKVLLKLLKINLKSKSRKNFLDKNALYDIDSKQKFIYFPLHQDEEHATLIGAPFFTNQIEAIKNIAQSLPVDYQLFVKESPVSGARDWREISDYKTILSLPNVELIHPSVNPHKIYEKCSLVITISGTSSLESLFYNKPSIVFSKTSFSGLSSIEKLDDLANLPNIIKKSLEKKIDFSELLDYYNYVEQISFDFNLQKLWDDIAITFNHNGLFIDNKINPEKINQFINLHESEYSILGNEYLKQIKSK